MWTRSVSVTMYKDYRIEEVTLRSDKHFSKRFVKVYYAQSQIDLTEVIAKVLNRSLSKSKKCYNSFYPRFSPSNLSCLIAKSIERHELKINVCVSQYLSDLNIGRP